MNKINICTSFDKNYWKYWTVMLFSLLKNINKNNKIDIYILTDGLSINIKNKIIKSLSVFDCEIKIIFCEYNLSFFKQNFSSLKLADYISPLTLYRLVIDKIIPDNIDRLLYLDSDMIVDCDIIEIYNLDLGDNIIWACKEIYIDLLNYNLWNIKLKNYFNAWLLLINLNEWRENKITEKILEFINKYWDKLSVADQDVLNYIFNKKTYFIHPQFNTPTTIYSSDNEKKSKYTKEEFFKTKNNPKIIHFFWNLKPWNWITHHPLSYKYYEYLKDSWLNEKKDLYKHIFHKIILFFLDFKFLRKIIRKIYLYKKWTIQDDPL